jgi:II/X family phage/plasmid replication protein
MSVTAEGEIEWQTPKWMQARGSHSCTLAVRARGDEIELSGSPAKFLQGHNAFGSDDMFGLGVAVIYRAADVLALDFTADERMVIDSGGVPLLRADVNFSYSTGGRANALAWIRASEQHGYLQHRGRGMLKGLTVVWGAKSRHWQMKAYCKGQELEGGKGHTLPAQLDHRGRLTAWCDDKLRIEVQMNARHLRDLRLGTLAMWKSDTASVIHSQHVAKLQLNGEMRIPADELGGLATAVRHVYELWLSGADVRGSMPKATFYKRRSQLIPFGVDIAVAVPNHRSNVVPLIRYVEAVAAAVPEWAIGTPLFFEPSRRRSA